jgi:hypothetical protein
MRDRRGWIRLHRAILDSELWSLNQAYLRLALAIFLDANWQDGEWRGVSVRRGELITSIRKLADVARISPKQVRSGLILLCRCSVIVRIPLRARSYTHLRVCNYDVYQNEDDAEGTANGTEVGNGWERDGHEKGNNIRSKKEERRIHTPEEASPPRAADDPPVGVPATRASGRRATEDAYAAADHLRAAILAGKPDHRLSARRWDQGDKIRNDWARTLDLMARRDGRTWEQIRRAIDLVRDQAPDQKFRFVVESSAGLREKYDRIVDVLGKHKPKAKPAFPAHMLHALPPGIE